MGSESAPVNLTIDSRVEDSKLDYKHLLAAVLMLSISGCVSYLSEQQTQGTDMHRLCLGNTMLPDEMADQFEAVEDNKLLNKSLGSPNEGKLCMGQVYKSHKDVKITLYRAWNSTNPDSKFGKWWAFSKPSGEVAQYRADYEICYQWTPLDSLLRCTLKPETKVVIGTGQSAKCSGFLTYPVSSKEQIYIDDASQSLSDCVTFNGEFSWK